MTTTARPRTSGGVVLRPVPARVLAVAALRQVRRGTVVVAVLTGVLPAFVAAQYEDTFGGAIDVASLTALATNPAVRTLFGPAVALDDAGGFTVWRTGTVLAVLVGTWAALTATRVTRGEEEAGRWDLLLSGPTTLGRVLSVHLGVLLGAAAVPGVTLAAGLLLVGTEPTGALLFGALIAGTGMLAAAVGVLAAQVLHERRAASGLAVGVLLGGLLIRMVGDGVPALSWVQWGTPFGLMTRAQPYGADREAPLLVLAAAVGLVATVGVRLAGTRDVGSGVLPGREVAVRPSRLVGSLGGFAAHRLRRPLLGWGTGLSAYFLLIGFLATSMIDFLRDNPLFAEAAAQAGFAELGSVEGYVAALFSLLPVLLGAFAAARVAASAADEDAGRLTLLFSRPLHRVRWAVVEAAAVLVGCLALAVVAGLATWVGTTVVGGGLAMGDALLGVLNGVPVALLCLGAALLALGWAPRAVLPIGVLPAAGGYLLQVLAETFGWPEVVREVSPFAHLAPVPAAPVDVAGTLGMLVVAGLLAVIGLVGYARRDLRA
jgi:ABC-2 type transport system permease protein